MSLYFKRSQSYSKVQPELQTFLAQCILSFNVRRNHQGIILKGRFWFSRPEVGGAQDSAFLVIGLELVFISELA